MLSCFQLTASASHATETMQLGACLVKTACHRFLQAQLDLETKGKTRTPRKRKKNAHVKRERQIAFDYHPSCAIAE